MLSVYTGADIYSDKIFSAHMMGLHASTSERAGQADDIYAMIDGYIRGNDTVADVGCGFNPFCLPYLPEKPKNYFAYDICRQTINLLNRYFKPMGGAYGAYILDAAAGVPDIAADVVLMLKLFPLLEQQKKGRAFVMLDKMKFRTAIVSFPTKSASGREKGMEAFYSGMFEGGLPERLKIKDKKIYENEMFYILEAEK